MPVYASNRQTTSHKSAWRSPEQFASYICYRCWRLDVEREHDVAPSVFRGIVDLTCFGREVANVRRINGACAAGSRTLLFGLNRRLIIPTAPVRISAFSLNLLGKRSLITRSGRRIFACGTLPIGSSSAIL